jgi:aldose 1-epimerase
MLMTMTTSLAAHGALAATAVSKDSFGKLPDGRAVSVYTVKNAELEVRFTDYGARIV